MSLLSGQEHESSIWTHSKSVCSLYRRRARQEDVEMTCAGQAATLLVGLSEPGQSLLDVGCGGGWFVHSLRSRGLDLDYWGVDATDLFVDIARSELTHYGVPEERILHGRVEFIEGLVDHVVCMNVLTNIDNWHRPLDRMCSIASETLILRESFGQTSTYSLVVDRFLDESIPLKVHVNRYSRTEVADFLSERGFDTCFVVDDRTGGQPEDVIGHPHHWEFLVARRRSKVRR